MSAFKEKVAQDVSRIFFDLQFFGESHTIEGVERTVVFDSEYLAKQKTEGQLGLEEATGLFFGQTKDFPKPIPSGNSIEIDGRDCIVVDWREDMGVTTVSYTQNRRR